MPTLYVIDEKGLVDLKKRSNGEYKVFCVYVTRFNNDVDDARKERDHDRIELCDDDIDMKIVNDYNSLEDFLENEGKRLVRALNVVF